MKNIMDMYLNFTEKKIRKYMRMFYSNHYDEEIINEYLKTYINARYYNIINANKPARAFYMRINDEIIFKQNILIKRNEESSENREEKEERLKLINNVKEVFAYIQFFDDVRKVDNFKKINSLKEIIKRAINVIDEEFSIKRSKDFIDSMYKEIKNDMIEKEIFLDKFETDEFLIDFENCEHVENLYIAKLDHKVKMPAQYSETAIEKVFSEGIVAEDKLQIEYILLSLISVRDIVNGEFKDIYIAEFTNTLFKKKSKMDSILSLIDNQALQAKIHINIDYSDYIKNQKTLLEYTNKGYNFTITLDNTIRSVEDVEKLKMFDFVIAPKNLVLYKELKQNKAILNNVIFK